MIDRRVQKTKLAIREAFIHLILDNKDPKLTITNIAKCANIDRKTFYLHYDSIDAVFKELAKEKLDDILVILEKNNYYDDIKNFIVIHDAIQEVLEADIQFYRRIAQNSHYHPFWKQLESLVKEAIVSVYGKHLDVAEDLLPIYSDFYASGLISIFVKWLSDDYDYDLSEMGNIIGMMMLKGFDIFGFEGL